MAWRSEKSIKKQGNKVGAMAWRSEKSIKKQGNKVVAMATLSIMSITIYEYGKSAMNHLRFF